MKFFGIIPARYASTRFPGKPLIEIDGKTMVQRVYEQAAKVNLLSKVLVATDDDRIYQHVLSFGGNAVITGEQHPSGTDRCYEAACLTHINNKDVVLNIQGDEPFISPLQIELLCKCFEAPNVSIATLVKRITSAQELESVSTPKVIRNNSGEAIYFSRSPIPYYRGIQQADWCKHTDYYKHIGIYGYRMKTLSELTKLTQSKLEVAESLEQLRWIENGYKIQTAVTEIESIAIDTPEDLNKLMAFKNKS